MFNCYILKSSRSSKYYVGSTSNIVERLKLHNSGQVPSTKKDRPWQLVHKEPFTSLREARRRELQIKKWKSRAAIDRLIKDIGNLDTKSRILDAVTVQTQTASGEFRHYEEAPKSVAELIIAGKK